VSGRAKERREEEEERGGEAIKLRDRHLTRPQERNEREEKEKEKEKELRARPMCTPKKQMKIPK